MRRLIIFALVLALTGYACVRLGAHGARVIERLLVARVENGLAVLGFDWARVRADGLKIELSGHAPDLASRELALASARATAPLARITDVMTAQLAPPPHQDPILVEMLRDDSGLTLTGRFHGEAMRRELLTAIGALAPSLDLHDLTGINAARPGPGWGPELAVAIHAAARVPNAYVRLEPGAVRVEGLARDEEHRQALSTELLALAGDKVRLTLVLRKPLVVVAPFVFSAVKDDSGRVRLGQCAARDAAEEAALEALVTRSGLEIGATPCPAALGGPSGDWPGAIAAGLEALALVPAGRFRLEYHTAALHGTAPTGRPELEAALTALVATLPLGYRVAGDLAEPEAADWTPRYWMRLAVVRSEVVISGMTPDATARQVVETHAAARFGRAAVHSALTEDPGAPPPGWDAAAMVALDALAGMPAGAAELSAGRLMVTGRLTDPARAGQVHRILLGEAPEGYEVHSALTVDLPAAVAAVPLSPARCAVVLGETVARSPIGFDPGSAVIDAESRPVLDKLAAVVARCPAGRFEIGGHTDSQGSDELNQRISQARAEAVQDALLARGIRLDRLTAHGYGEENPMASNATEAGRARNRRIEFTAIE